MSRKLGSEVWSFVVGFLAFVLTTTIFQFFRIHGILFNTGIVLSVCAIVVFGLKEAMISTLVYATLVDLFVSRLLGVNFLIYFIILFLLEKVKDEFYVSSMALPTLLITLSTFLFQGLYAFVMSIFGAMIPWSYFFTTLCIELLYNVVIGLLCYRLLFRIAKGHVRE